MKRIYFITLFALVLMTGCKSTSEFTKTDTVKKDSLVVKELVRVSMPASVKFTIDKPCDSLGNLIPFNQEVKTEYVKVYVAGQDNVVYAEVDIQEIESKIRTELQKEFDSKVTDKLEAVTDRHIPKFMWYVLVYAIVGSLWHFKKPLLKLIKTFI